MRFDLLPSEGKDYKANLHCHSTYSDGKLTPEEIKRAYQEHGYSIVAYTDHNVIVDHSELRDEAFLPLRGYEVDVNNRLPDKDTPYNRIRTTHICLVDLLPERQERFYWFQKKQNGDASVEELAAKGYLPEPGYEREYSPEGVSKIMQNARRRGFFVTYNHPQWSMNTREEYVNYHGMHAMEICNYGCYEAGYEDYNPGIYDELLRSGKRIFCIGADDNHNLNEHNWARDSFGAYTVIRAKALDYASVADALVKGSFYASMGPEIHDLYMEDGWVHITCSPAKRVMMNTQVRRAKSVWAPEGELLTKASFEVKPDCGYIRLSVMDEQGRYANSQAYFLDQFPS